MSEDVNMFTVLKKIGLITILSFISIIINSCEPQSPNETRIYIEENNENKSVGYLRIPLNGPVTTLDPGQVIEENGIELLEQLFLGLTDFAWDKKTQTYKVVPELALELPQVNEDGTRYTFQLRSDVKWTDGHPVTAHDLVWAIQRHLTTETESQEVSILYLIKNAKAIHQQESEFSQSGVQAPDNYGHSTTTASKETLTVDLIKDAKAIHKEDKFSQLGVRALDDYTIEFELEHAAAYFPALVSVRTFRPLPHHVIEKYGAKWSELKHIQTNGPYQLKEWDKGNKIVLTKNPLHYEADKVAINEVHYYVVPSNRLGLKMYEKNELDLMGGSIYLRLPQTEILRIKTADVVLSKELRIAPRACTEWYGFNTQRPPTDNLLVRKAIAAALNKQLLIEVILKGFYLPALTFTHPLVFGAVSPQDSANVGIPFNPQQANQWLKESGYGDLAETENNIILMHSKSEFHHEIAQGVKTLLKHYLDIKITVDGDKDFGNYLDLLFSSKRQQIPHLFRIGWCMDYPDAHGGLYRLFHPKQGYFDWLLHHNLEKEREFMEMIELAQQTIEQEKRQQYYRRAEQILVGEEVVILPVFFETPPMLVKPWVKNWYNKAFGGQHIRDWSLTTD
jgi:oligopeptide transport system substrate-binding protein